MAHFFAGAGIESGLADHLDTGINQAAQKCLQFLGMNRVTVAPSEPSLGTYPSCDGNVWRGGFGLRIPLTMRSPTGGDRYCEAYVGRVRCGVAVHNNVAAGRHSA